MTSASSDEQLYPRWLLQSYNELIKTKEWSAFVGEFYDVVDQQLIENHVSQFSELTEAEKQLFLERGVNALQSTPVYNFVMNNLSQTLDKHLNSLVDGELSLGKNPFLTRTELILSSGQDAIISILSRWPELRIRLTRYLNQPLPRRLRCHVWRAFLSNNRVLQTYRLMLKNKYKEAISAQDKSITDRVKLILDSEAVFHELKGSVGAFYGIKAVLSYFHALTKSNERLLDSELLLMIPFVLSIHESIPKREPPDIRVMEVLVQQYFTFMANRPRAMLDGTNSQLDEQFRVNANRNEVTSSSFEPKTFAEHVMRHVAKMDPRLAQLFMDAFAPSQVNIVATEAKLYEVLGDSITSLIRPMVRPLFVGILNSECLLFVWDQYILGLDMPSYSDIFLPIIVACFLVLLKNSFLSAGENANIYETIVKREGPKLKSTDFQYLINRYFLSDLMHYVSQDKLAPSMDPTVENVRGEAGNVNQRPKWHEWYSQLGKPRRTELFEREQFRLWRESERQRIQAIERENKDKNAELQRLAEQLKEIQEAHKFSIQAVANRAELERSDYVRQLVQERDHFVALQSRTAEELARLQAEIERLKNARLETPDGLKVRDLRPPTGSSIGSLYVFPPPPATPQSHASPLPEVLGLSSSNTSIGLDKAILSVEEYLSSLMMSTNKLLHGSTEEEQNSLNEASERHLGERDQDRRDAETELFGHVMTDADWEAVSPENKIYYADKIQQGIIKRNIGRAAARNQSTAAKK